MAPTTWLDSDVSVSLDDSTCTSNGTDNLGFVIYPPTYTGRYDSQQRRLVWYLDSANATSTAATFTWSTATSNANTITYVIQAGNSNDAWPPLTPEAQRAVDEAFEKERQRLAIIERKGEKLLRRLLTSRQRHTWEQYRYITVPSHVTPGVVYRIPDKGMIRMFHDGKPVKDLCIYPVEALPVGDKIAVFKLMIESDESELHRIANVHPIRERDRRVVEGGAVYEMHNPANVAVLAGR